MVLPDPPGMDPCTGLRNVPEPVQAAATPLELLELLLLVPLELPELVLVPELVLEPVVVPLLLGPLEPELLLELLELLEVDVPPELEVLEPSPELPPDPVPALEPVPLPPPHAASRSVVTSTASELASRNLSIRFLIRG
ncbi:MAG TPA: hypothetical protein VHZ99_02785 [Steroidobacteraceae bacterium]|jgi:hypothetical protein|nr:hypothetical protein [Steroidobacteraceae bacterium]